VIDETEVSLMNGRGTMRALASLFPIANQKSMEILARHTSDSRSVVP
jgi:hypothetical protein